MITGLDAREKTVIVRALVALRHVQENPFISCQSHLKSEVMKIKQKVQRDLDHVGSYDSEEVDE